MSVRKEYQICTRCVMDTTDPLIVFDQLGVCNHCHSYTELVGTVSNSIESSKFDLNQIVSRIKSKGVGKKYDCIIGVSGGVDSTYVAYLAKKLDLRGLLVHLDNGWDSELAVKNVESIVNYTGFDLYTLVIDWDEFKDLQRAFFKADVVDIELLSDHAIFATVYNLAIKYDIKYLLSGENIATEAILPRSWVWRKSDARNIRAIHALFGQMKLSSYPFMSTVKHLIYTKILGKSSVRILDFLDYKKDEVKALITEEVGWRDYGGKHFESIFTRFYQGYILPKKFNIDKRRAHLSTLVNSGQLNRITALKMLEKPTYLESLQSEDFDLVAKKLDMSREELNSYFERPGKDHLSYSSDQGLYEFLFRLQRIIRKCL